MLTYTYGSKAKDESEKNEVKSFSLTDLGITAKDPLPDKFESEGRLWTKLMDTKSLFRKIKDPSKTVIVHSLTYFLQMGKLPLHRVWVEGEEYAFDRVIDGVPNFADFSDTMRQMHDDSYHVKFTKPPLEAESSNWGYGLT